MLKPSALPEDHLQINDVSNGTEIRSSCRPVNWNSIWPPAGAKGGNFLAVACDQPGPGGASKIASMR